jgi:NADH-quinone oxidoreductase subunit H
MLYFILVLILLLTFALVGVYAERKISGLIQDRLGPMQTGKYGSLQTFADVLKLLQKEDIVPQVVSRFLFKLAPLLVFASVVGGYALLPLHQGGSAAQYPLAIYALLAILTFDVLGILLAGWASNSKFALYGALRAVAQMIAYEIPLILSLLAVAIYGGSLDLQLLSLQQGIFSPTPIPVLGFELRQVGGFWAWHVVQMPLLGFVFLIFFIASLAEANRAPFDLPEAESELIAGFQTEYSGLRWALLMLAEYGLMLFSALLAVVLFFGSWNTPLPNIGTWQFAHWTSGTFWSIFWLFGKALILVYVQMWVRWTYPRLRIDQLMALAWKYLLPFSLFFLVLMACIRVLGL